MDIAQFVLDARLLPGGRLPLRVFEPRYLQMVADASAGRRPFGLCMPDRQNAPNTPQRLSAIGTLVDVIDFEPLADGRLGIIVEGRQRYRIDSSYQQPDKLHVAQATLLPPWPEQPLHEPASGLASLLEAVLTDHPELAALYPQPQFADGAWLAARWLELLPLPAADYQQLAAAPDADEALRYLHRQLDLSSSAKRPPSNTAY
ncbi:LON peptidase substrate-binding domain-containing protein [Gallaecimonas sp. GXIMD1310]|uniref:LON peptidase substrate-binding domain-containing protein n=1 Tax=Gallaecimonas sp. GXIMD1310 TaxID=3131926 RepID=UPI003255A893